MCTITMQSLVIHFDVNSILADRAPGLHMLKVSFTHAIFVCDSFIEICIMIKDYLTFQYVFMNESRENIACVNEAKG